MLDFMRKYADKIIISILVAFVLSIVIAEIYSNLSGGKRSGGKGRNVQQQRVKGQLATVNGKEINARTFMRMYNNGLLSFRSPTQKDPVDPRAEAVVRYSSVRQSIDFEKYLAYAKKVKVRVSGREVDAQIKAIVDSYKLKSLKEFKELLKANGYKYNEFKQDIKNEMMINKLFMVVRDRVIVTDKDVKDQYKKVRARHILIAVPYTEDKEQYKAQRDAARARAAQLYDKIVRGADFAKLAAESSDDPGSRAKGGDLGYFGANMMVRQFEEVAFALDKGQSSKPFETPYGFHIVKVEDIKQDDIPLDVDEAELKKKLTEQRQNAAIAELRQKIQQEYVEEIADPLTQAFDLRAKGQLDKALVAYRLQSSQYPSSPYPYLFTAEIYELQKKYPEALGEYKRALLLEKTNPSAKTPFVHFYLGQMYAQQKQNAKAAAEFDIALSRVTDSPSMLESLKDAYKKIGYTNKARVLEVRIKQLETAQKQPAAAAAEDDIVFDDKDAKGGK